MKRLKISILIFSYTMLISCLRTTQQDDRIHVSSPKAHTVVSTEFTIEGEARGMWYFEATFPIQVQDANGNMLLQTYAEAQSNWMTEDFVPFTKSITIPVQERTEAMLILKRANASDLPEHDAEIYIPLTIAP